MKFSEIQELVKLINKSNLTEFKLKEGDFEISIRTKNYGKVRAKDIQALQSSVPQVVSVPAPMQAMAAAPAPVAAAPAPIPAEAPASENKNTLLIKSPIVGTFYRSAGPDKENYVGIGSIVEVGTVVCIVEAMKLLNEIECDQDGIIKKILVENGQPVEFGEPLFVIG